MVIVQRVFTIPLRLGAFACLACLLAARAGAQPLVPNAVEADLAQRAIARPDQGRSTMVHDPYLHLVARAKAADMGRRGYFGHTDPDGYGPNYVIRMTGYILPAHYNMELGGNNVESIAAGYPTAEQAFLAWMNSPGHRRHILAEESFYKEQTRYGVGYAKVPGSAYKDFYVFVTAPPSTAPLSPLSQSTIDLFLSRTPSHIESMVGPASTSAPGLSTTGQQPAGSPSKPIVTMLRSMTAPGRRQSFAVTATDDAGISRVQRRLKAPGGKKFGSWTAWGIERGGNDEWTVKVMLPKKGKWRIQVRAFDVEGNTSKIRTMILERR